MKDKKLIIIDGNSLVNRAFYAIPDLTNSKGMHTNAIYGFANILFRIISEYNPTHMSVAFDLKAPTFRHKMYEGYKGTRKKMPQELYEQMQPLKDMLDKFGISRLELEGFEADDIIGTVTKLFSSEKIKNYVITGDRDSFQLASDFTTILFTKKGISELDIIDENEMMNIYGITPKEFIDLKALMGDTSDNIPGVPGIGEKTGLKLIKQYHNIDAVYENIDDLKGAMKKKLEENKDLAYLSKTLATINTDIPVSLSTDELELKEINTQELREFFIENDMLSLVKKLEMLSPEDMQEVYEKEAKTQEKIEKISSTEEFLKSVKDEIFIKSVKEESLVNQKSILSLCIYSDGKYFAIPESDIPTIKSVLEDENIKKSGYDIKTEYLSLLPYGVKLKPLDFDLKIAQYLLDPDKSNYDISEIAQRYSAGTVMSNEEFFGKGKSKMLVNGFTKNQVEDYFLECIRVTKDVKEEVLSEIKKEDMAYLFEQVEMKLVKVLADMEFFGVEIDKEELLREKEEFAKKISDLEKQIYEIAGEEFNINSPKQLGVILFEKLNLPVIKKTKTGYSTNAQVLEELCEKHEIAQKIIDYRQITKLQSTYVEGLLNIINPDTKRIHSSFNQTITATGRISSTEPNLQNIPVRQEMGRNLRKAFIAKDGCVLVDSDYSQIELRVLSHISNEQALIDAFKKEVDIHTQTASEVFGVNIEDVTKEQRSAAKAVNFGIVYGISDFGLSTNLGITKKKAGEYIKGYLDRYKNVEKYMDDIVKQAEKDGYVTTILKRRRYIPELKQKNFVVKNLGKRLAMNTPIQGSAADIIKIAMIRVSERLEREKLKSRLILQVHDELIIESPEDEKDYVKNLLKEEMQNAYEMKVDLKVDINTGRSWFDTK